MACCLLQDLVIGATSGVLGTYAGQPTGTFTPQGATSTGLIIDEMVAARRTSRVYATDGSVFLLGAYSVAPDGSVALINKVNTIPETPWNLALDKQEQWLLAAEGNFINAYHLAPDSGAIITPGLRQEVLSCPACPFAPCVVGIAVAQDNRVVVAMMACDNPGVVVLGFDADKGRPYAKAADCG